MDLILFGIQGSGKGTQGKKIIEKHGLKLFETGAELRKLAAENSELGKKIKNIIESGKLVPNEVVMEIIENFIETISKEDKILFDGIPRSIIQSHSLKKILEEKKRPYKALLIEIPKEEAIKRLTTRRVCSSCKENYPVFYKEENCASCGAELITRSDDNIDSINVRLETYQQETVPVINEFKQEDKLITIDGQQSIEDVTKDVFNILDPIYS